MALLFISYLGLGRASAQVAVRAEKVYTMVGPPIVDGVILFEDGKISAIGKASGISIPSGFETLVAKIATPGLIDAHATVGFSGLLNTAHDQDQLEHSAPIQPELRGIDAYNGQDELVAWVRSFGVTTMHTGHAPGELISGQTLIVKTTGNTVDDALLRPACAVAVTLSTAAQKSGSKSPGTRGKMVAMLRAELIKAQAYAAKRAKFADSKHSPDDEEDGGSPPPRDLRLEALADVLAGNMTLMITANRAQDIASALRIADEFNLSIWLDGATEAYTLLNEIKASGCPVLIHPTMQRAAGESENLSFETASRLVKAGIPVAMQSGYESYVPKTRIALFEAALAAANGLTFEQALGSITIDAAKILGIADRVGSIEVGKDGDIALYDGDPFEYTTHCVGVVINGEVVSRQVR